MPRRRARKRERERQQRPWGQQWFFWVRSVIKCSLWTVGIDDQGRVDQEVAQIWLRVKGAQQRLEETPANALGLVLCTLMRASEIAKPALHAAGYAGERNPVSHLLNVQTSRTQAGCPRMLCAYSSLWEGPRPAVVISATNLREVEENRVRANVSVDGEVDQKLLAIFRARPEGNTILGNLYDPLSDEQRAAFRARGAEARPVYWFEWPAR